MPLVCRSALIVLCGVLCAGCGLLPERVGPPALPVTVQPAEGAELVANARTRFVWRPVPGADRYDFHVYDRETRDISRYGRDDLRARDVCDDETCSIVLSVSLARMKDHAWRVRATNRAGRSEWSRTRFAMVDVGGVAADPLAGPFDTAASARRTPTVPLVLAPVGATLRPGEVVTFEWGVVEGASGYDFHVYDATTRELVADTRGLVPADACDASGRCALTLALMLPVAANHAWRVRAVNRWGTSNWTRTPLAVVP